jgi:hypothetical protein
LNAAQRATALAGIDGASNAADEIEAIFAARPAAFREPARRAGIEVTKAGA